MRFSIGLFIIVLIFGCNNRQTNDNELIELTAKTINDSINHGKAFYVDSIRILDSITKNKYIDFRPLRELNLFTDKDFESMDSQNKVEINYDFKKLINKGYVLLRKDYLKAILGKEHHKTFYAISKPLYSLDYNNALINVDFVCYDCGRGHILIMEKVNDKWILKKIIYTWIN